MKTKHTILLLLFCFAGITAYTQVSNSAKSNKKKAMLFYLSEDSVCYLKATAMAQVWLRYNDNNPGSTIYNKPADKTFDVGLRRVRYQVMSQINKKVFLYTQIGINSFSSLSARKSPIFFHDVTGEYAFSKNYFTLGAGLTGWNGTSRYSSSGVTNILAMDLPVIQETVNDVTDQFVRKLGVYAKGQIERFDYRISASNPFPVQTALSTVSTLPSNDTNVSYFSTNPPKMLYQGYFFYQFMDKESNQLPYMAGSYIGKKRILNLGCGFANQEDAMWHRNLKGDTVLNPLRQLGVDVFFDYYLNSEKRNAITAYISYMNYDFGPNYLRNAAIMNTANGTNANSSFNGSGNSMPMYGTGNVFYCQAAYLFRHDLLKSEGTIQPYAQCMYANYQKLNDPVIIYNLGVNWIQDGQNSKISLDYQSRPIFNKNSNNQITETRSARRGMIVLQYQISI